MGRARARKQNGITRHFKEGGLARLVRVEPPTYYYASSNVLVTSLWIEPDDQVETVSQKNNIMDLSLRQCVRVNL